MSQQMKIFLALMAFWFCGFFVGRHTSSRLIVRYAPPPVPNLRALEFEENDVRVYTGALASVECIAFDQRTGEIHIHPNWTNKECGTPPGWWKGEQK